MEKCARLQKKRLNNSVFSELFRRYPCFDNALHGVYYTKQMPARNPQQSSQRQTIYRIIPNKCLSAIHNLFQIFTDFYDIIPNKCLSAIHNLTALLHEAFCPKLLHTDSA